MFIFANQYECFMLGQDFISTEDKALFISLRNNEEKFNNLFKKIFKNYSPTFSDLIKLYIFVSEIATEEQKQNIIDSIRKTSKDPKRSIVLFMFPIKFLEYYQALIEENLFPFSPSEDNREKKIEKREKSKQDFYKIQRRNKILHVNEYDLKDKVLDSYKDLPQYLTYNITQFELNNIKDYYNMCESVYNCQDSASLKKVLKDRYGSDINFFDTEFSTYSMDTNQYNIIKCIQGSHNGKISIEPLGENKYLILFLNRAYHANPKFKAKKNKFAKEVLIKYIMRSISLSKNISDL